MVSFIKEYEYIIRSLFRIFSQVNNMKHRIASFDTFSFFFVVAVLCGLECSGQNIPDMIHVVETATKNSSESCKSNIILPLCGTGTMWDSNTFICKVIEKKTPANYHCDDNKTLSHLNLL